MESCSNASNDEHVCHVFMNYDDSEVRKNLASHLQRCLSRNGLHVFPNQRELQGGDNSRAALKEAKVHIAIFSTGYANSSQCLNELVQMLESGSTVIPVFYNVSPSDLRWTKEGNGVYAQALSMLQGKKTTDSETHEEKALYCSNTIGKWRKALFDVAGKSGFVLDAYNGDEGKLVYKIVKRVLKKLKNHFYYDVFINHRGPDVKETFASHLYHCLRAHGLRVFLDIEELQKGEIITPQTERAIRGASVHIAIFSKNYAESIWCLHELSLMLKSQSTILPVFYDVEPSVLQDTDGRYSKCLKKLEGHKIYTPDKITEWRNALSKVPETDDFNLEKYDGDEGKLAHHLVREVLSEIVTQNAAKLPTRQVEIS